MSLDRKKLEGIPRVKYSAHGWLNAGLHFSKARRSYVLFLVLAVSPLSASVAQLHIDGNALIINQSSRAEALGLSYVSEPVESGAMYWNPALLAYTRGMQLSAGGYYVWNETYASAYASWAYRVGARHGVGVGVRHIQYGTIWSSPTLLYQSLDIGYSFRIFDVLSLGILGAFGRAQTSSEETYSVFSTVGVYYAPNSGIRYGICYEGFGTLIDYANYSLEKKTGLSRILRAGASYSFPIMRQEKILTISISGEKHMGLKGYHYFLGLEVSPIQAIDLRIGYVKKPVESTYYTSGARFGAGIHLRQFSVDYVASPSISALRHHQLTVRIQLLSGGSGI